MEQFAALHDRMGSADGLAAVLEASWSALSAIESACWEWQSSARNLFAAFIFANVAAAEARMALAVAPSLPAGPADPAGDLELSVRGDVADVADAIASLAGALVERLTEVGPHAAEPEDRAACARTAAGARRIVGMLERGKP